MEEDKQLVKVEENLPTSNENIQDDLKNKIDTIASKDDLQEVAALFNLNITKKEMARAMQQDELLDLILQQAGERLRKRPDELSTKDLLDYMNAFQNNLQRTQDYIDRVEDSPAIQINDNKQVTVNIGSLGALNRNSCENVIDALNDVFKSLGDNQTIEDVVDMVDVSDKAEVEENND